MKTLTELQRIRYESQALQPPSVPYRRPEAIRLCPPGVDEPAKRSDADEQPLLTGVISDAIETHGNIKEIEYLMYSGREHHESLLIPYIKSGNPSDSGTYQTGIKSFTNDGEFSALRTAADNVAGVAEANLPEEVGIERCSVDLDPLGRTPIRVGRLLLKAGRDPLAVTLRYNVVDWVTRQLDAQNVPYLIQVFVREGSDHKYRIAVRLAVFDLTEMSPRQRSIKDLLDETVAYDPALMTQDAALTSNFQMPIRDHFKPFWDSYLVNPAKYKNRSDSKMVGRLFAGLKEYEELLQGHSDYEEIYPDVLGYPRWPVSRLQLRQFTPFVLRYYDESPWESLQARDPPVLDVDEIYRPAPGTDTGLGSTVDTPSTALDDAPATAGSGSHEALLQFAMRYYREQGISVDRVEQDTRSVPDGHLWLDDQQGALEIVWTSKKKPSKPFTNAARALLQDQFVVFVTEDDDVAESVREMLQQPYKATAGDGVILENWTGGVSLPDGGQPLLPSEYRVSEWRLTSDGTLELYPKDGDELLASGPATDSVATFEFATPRYVVTDDGSHQARSQTGEVIDETQTRSTLLDDWTRVQPPHVPVTTTYLTDASVVYRDRNELVPYQLTPDWAADADSKRARYRGAVSAFLDDWVIVEEGGEIELSTFYDVFNEWYRAQLSTEMGYDDREIAIAETEIGRALPEWIERKRREEDDGWTRYLTGVSWRAPLDIVSPNLPMVSDDGSLIDGLGNAGTEE